MNRQVRKARAIAIARTREDQHKIILRSALMGLVASGLVYGFAYLAFWG
ncbi:hypothetical protein NAC44_03315 [Allorhizobium sp. BGMRC 0089]|nr:hypothetical protein [Allorhizobium sonneratiae]MCM2291356.1 hypothetical protein [Allorhizobium sonneratiae]